MTMLGMQGNIIVVNRLAKGVNKKYYELGHETCIVFQCWIFLQATEQCFLCITGGASESDSPKGESQ